MELCSQPNQKLMKKLGQSNKLKNHQLDTQFNLSMRCKSSKKLIIPTSLKSTKLMKMTITILLLLSTIYFI